MKQSIVINASGNSNWIGGLYYLKNIVFELSQNHTVTSHYRLILFTVRKNFNIFKSLRKENVKIIVVHGGVLSKVEKVFLSFLYNARFSYYGTNSRLDNKLNIVTINWIPDFQHKHLSNLFNEYELKQRDKEFTRIANSSEPLILSSNDCLNDFRKFYSETKKNVYVIPFVSYIDDEIKGINESFENSVLKKYNLEKNQYVYIPNQFWKHKNHIMVLKAVKEFFKHNDSKVKFIFTGKMFDQRNQDYIESLKEMFNYSCFQGKVYNLGFIDRKEQLVIMKDAKYLIQPSLFEGWGTVLEDAKVLDKTLLLSDIPVHREQKSNKCILFDPQNHLELEKLIELENKKNHFSDIDDGVKDMYIRAKIYSRGFEKLLNDCGGLK
ncbi:glycosyltransferase [Liquorilactobacillus hordei]|uniref:glycosyltransferase n=1 Tax=Liquorilactobacillus hordei TaxID=468911 RepID=UPI00070B13D9|nr:glycosyltransferase [Liquorilactobacillus hordei]QYH52204.1 glycosyltransferase family 4 protein [Liquorilactobacillus hordei DSM 19519]